MTNLELLKELSNPNAFVRFRVAQELGDRDDHVVRIDGRDYDVVDMLLNALKSKNLYARYGACWGLKMAGRDSKEAVDALVRILQEEDDFTLRLLANLALGEPDHLTNTKNALIGDVRKRAKVPLLKLTAGYVTGDTITGENYQEATLHQRFGETVMTWLFGEWRHPDKKGFMRADRTLIYSAIRSVLANPDKARPVVRQVVAALGLLDEEELNSFMAEIYQVAQSSLVPVGRQFATRILAERHIKEAIPIAATLLEENTHARSTRWPNAMEALAMFGKDGIEPHATLIQERMKQCKASWGRKYKKSMERYLRIDAKMAEVRDKTFPLQSIKTYQEDARKRHGLTAYCLLTEPAKEKGVKLTWFQGRIMPTSGRLFRDGKAVGAVDPAKGYYVDYEAPRGKVDYRIDFKLPKGDVITREATFGGRLEDLRGELGILDPTQNDGINPGTTIKWEVGDAYRLIFVSSEKSKGVVRTADLTAYDKFVTDLAKKAGIGGTWKVLAESTNVEVEQHTDTDPKTANYIPVFLIDGETLVAKNYGDLWRGAVNRKVTIRAPINQTETGEVLTEGVVATGAPPWSFGKGKGVNVGNLAAGPIFWWKWKRGGDGHLYAISEVLHVKTK